MFALTNVVNFFSYKLACLSAWGFPLFFVLFGTLKRFLFWHCFSPLYSSCSVIPDALRFRGGCNA